MEPDKFSTKKIIAVYQRVSTIVNYEEMHELEDGSSSTQSEEIVIHSYTRPLPDPQPVELS